MRHTAIVRQDCHGMKHFVKEDTGCSLSLQKHTVKPDLFQQC